MKLGGNGMDIGTLLTEGITQQMLRENKYRKDCMFCVKVANIPIDICFCSAGMKLREVNIIPDCSKSCQSYIKEE